MTLSPKHLGFTLIEIIIVSVIFTFFTIGGYSLSLGYKEKHELEAAQINIKSFLELSKNQAILNYDLNEHGFLISPSSNKFTHITRASISSTEVKGNNIKISDSISITSPNSDTTTWFNKKTGFISNPGSLDKITIETKNYSTSIEITNSGIFNSSTIIRK